jgi:TolA-binding protein
VEGVSTIATLIANKANLINNPNFNRFSVPDAKDYIEMSEAYALVSPRDPQAGDQLVKAGNQAKAIDGYAAKAVVMYDWLIEKQPNHSKAAQALFLKAFTYDNELKKTDTAEKYYKEFIAKYPNDDFADDAQLLLDNIGKTDQEFYESIVKKKGTEKE